MRFNSLLIVAAIGTGAALLSGAAHAAPGDTLYHFRFQDTGDATAYRDFVHPSDDGRPVWILTDFGFLGGNGDGMPASGPTSAADGAGIFTVDNYSDPSIHPQGPTFAGTLHDGTREFDNGDIDPAMGSYNHRHTTEQYLDIEHPVNYEQFPGATEQDQITAARDALYKDQITMEQIVWVPDNRLNGEGMSGGIDAGQQIWFRSGQNPNQPIASRNGFKLQGGNGTTGPAGSPTGPMLHIYHGDLDGDLIQDDQNPGGAPLGSLGTTLVPQADGGGSSADFNGNGVVDAADYTVWRDNLGATDQPDNSTGDATGDGSVTEDDYQEWKDQFGQTGGEGLTLEDITWKNADWNHVAMTIDADRTAMTITAELFLNYKNIGTATVDFSSLSEPEASLNRVLYGEAFLSGEPIEDAVYRTRTFLQAWTDAEDNVSNMLPGGGFDDIVGNSPALLDEWREVEGILTPDQFLQPGPLPGGGSRGASPSVVPEPSPLILTLLMGSSLVGLRRKHL